MNEANGNKFKMGLGNICGVIGFAIGVLIAPKILEKVCSIGSEKLTYDYYKVIEGMITKKI